MSLILSGTDGLSDVDGSAATPAIRGTDANTGIFFPAADTIAFAEGGAEVARFNSSGNFGLGATPSSWGAGTSVIDLATSGNAGAVSASGTLSIANNGFFNGTDWIYKNTSSALLYQLISNQHRWSIAPSGTAGNTITFTQAMTLDASGNLALGSTTSLSSSSNRVDLTVNGTSSSMVSFGTGGTRRGYALHDATDFSIASETAGALRFLNNGSERARIDSSGNLLVGATTQPWNATAPKLAVLQTAADYSAITANSNSVPYGHVVYYNTDINNTGSEFLYCRAASTIRAAIRSNGGIANYTANDVNLSDRREKTNFAPAKSYLDVICAIPVQTFNYIDQSEDDPGLTLGVVAQDVQAVAPELVMESDWSSEKDGSKTRLSIYQTDLQYALMKCIQEQQALITQLTARITALESA